jgi:hypothetical protein
MRSIEHQRSNLLFFNGDMIMGYGNASLPASLPTVPALINSDIVKFHTQYAFWRGLIAPLMETGTYVVPVPGNHETQCKSCPDAVLPAKRALKVNEQAWRDNMSDLILDNARFQRLLGDVPSNENTGDNKAYDGLPNDQSKLSYGFDLRDSHFVVINTDPSGDASGVHDAHAPVNWLRTELALAQARGVRHIFVFGRKPAYTYYYGAGASAPLPTASAGLDNDPGSRDAFWDVIAQYHATYFCGHEHIFQFSQHASLHQGTAWQILVGSGGSAFEAKPADMTVKPSTDRDYAWATVKVYESGRVKITGYGFDDHYGPTHVIGGGPASALTATKALAHL